MTPDITTEGELTLMTWRREAGSVSDLSGLSPVAWNNQIKLPPRPDDRPMVVPPQHIPHLGPAGVVKGLVL